MKKVRILHIVEELSAAGIESFIMNMYRRIDKNFIQFDFLVLRHVHEFYDDEIKSLGGNKFCISSKKKNTLFKVYDESKKIEKFLTDKKYEIVHIHYTTSLRAPFLKACYNAGVKTRIYHSHSGYVIGKNLLKRIIYHRMKKVISKYGTHYFACSKVAAEWVFEKKLIENDRVKIIFNGIDTKRFKYDVETRKDLREKLNLINDFTLIHTGRFTHQKNQSFLLKVFDYIYNTDKNVRLIFLGDGELLQEVKQEASKLGLSNKVYFMGIQQNVEMYLNAADCFVMPSLYEGLPVSAVEAQSTGLPCVFSENISREVSLINNCSFLSLDSPISIWADKILEYKKNIRQDESYTIKKEGYDVESVASFMQNFYISQICGDDSSL